MNYSLNMKEVTFGLSEALDFVGIDDVMHGKRVAYMAVEIAKYMNWSEADIDDLYYIGMLHDCGVSSTNVHTHLVTELDWNDSYIHCIKGEELLKKTKVYNKYALYIRHHHTHWIDLDDELSLEIKRKSNLVYMVDRIDALRAQNKEYSTENIEKIKETIYKFTNSMFCEEFVNAFLDISKKSSFWFFLEDESLIEYCNDWITTGKEEIMEYTTLKELALMFASVVDAKSKFTAEHSIGVSNLAKYIAQNLDLNKKQCETIELAGLFHDLGKLKVDDEILNKPSALDKNERLKMNRHGFDSYIILHHIKSFKEIAYLASLHHETLDGNGYPYGLENKKIPIEARILAVADIFQALVQDRPYRKGLNMLESLKIIEEMLSEGKLDYDVVQELKNNIKDCYKYALCNELVI